MFSKIQAVCIHLRLFILAGALLIPYPQIHVSALAQTVYSKIAPLNGAVIPLPATTYQLLQWSDAAISSTDRYQYCIDETDNSQCDNNNWITRNALYSGGPGEFTLSIGHTYYWQVRTQEDGTTADNGTWWKFTIQSAVTFIKISPPNGTIIPLPASTYQLLQWAGAPKDSTDRYQYCIDETNNSLCDNNTWVTKDALSSGGPGEFTLAAGHVYYWQVKLRDAGVLSDNGTWWSFTVQPPNPFNKISPANEAIIPMPASTYQFLQWTDPGKNSTDRYQYCIDQTNNSQCDNNNWFTRDSLYSGGPGEFALVEGVTYYWQVRLRDALSYANGGTWWSFTIKPSIPSVLRITRTAPSPTAASSVGFMVTFSESVTGVDTTDFILSSNLLGAVINSVMGSSNIYIVTVTTGSGNGTVRLDLVDNDSIVTALNRNLGGVGAGNGNFNLGETYSIDRTAPAIISIARADANPSNAASLRFNVTFSEPVTGVDLSDFSLSTGSGAALNSISGSGANYIISATTGTGSGTLRLDFIDNDTVVDLVGNPTSAGFISGESYTIDHTPPSAVSISLTGQPNSQSAGFIVIFSEPVNGVDTGDFQLSTLNGAAITNISGFGNSYTVVVALRPGNDTIQLNLHDNDSIMDIVGNPLGGQGFGNGNAASGNVSMIVNVPVVTSIIRAGTNPTNAQSLNFIVTFSEPVNGVDAGDFQISNGVIAAIANQNPFYVVTITGVNEGTVKLDLIDNDSIQNIQGVSLGGTGVGNANFTYGEAFTIDRTPPQVTSIIRAGANPAIGATAEFIVTFSEPVIGVEATDFVVSQSNVIKSTVINLHNLDPFYWVTVKTGAGSGTIRLDLLDNGNISDHAGNKLIPPSFTSGEIFSLAKTTVDFSAPILTLSNASSAGSPPPGFSWSPVQNAQAYEYFIARDSAFVQIVSVQTVFETTTQIQTQFPDGTYYIQVRAYNADLNPGKFSNTISVTVDSTPPSAPRLISPKNNAEAPSRPWLRWSIISDGTQYQVEVDNDADFTSPTYSALTTNTSVQTQNLPRKTYYWRVRVKDAAGNWSNWSGISTFIIK